MSKEIFKIGDRVYCILSGWGTVDKFTYSSDYPMTVMFDIGNAEHYTTDGRFYFNSPPILSFTEYTLNGFSQERPIELPELGEEIMVSDDGKTWEIGRFREYTPQYKYPVEVEIGEDKYSYSYFKRLR